MFGYIPISANGFSTAQTVGIFSAGIIESASANDAYISAISFAMALSESVTTADVIAAVIVIPVALSETSSANEVLAATLTLPAAITEIVSVADALAYQLTLAAAVTETGSATDTTVPSFVYFVSQAEAATADAAQTAILTMVANAAEALSGQDAYANNMVFAMQIVALGSVVDDYSAAGSVYNVNLLDALNAQDAMTRRLLWEPEPDPSVPTWAPQSDVSTVWVKKDDNTGIWTIINPEGLPPQ